MHRTLTTLGLAVTLVWSCGGEPSDSATEDGAEAPAEPTFPLDPDIWTAALSRDADGAFSIGPPVEAIHRPGYDNQPHFTPDGSAFWFTALEEHTEQTDIWRYDLSGSVERVTVSVPESEYSATPLPDGSGLSVVRVEADSTQRLWHVPSDGSEPGVLLPDVAPVGYHAWVDAETVALFVLGDPPTLQVANVTSGSARPIAENIGRSIRSIPGEDAVSFVQMEDDGTAVLTRYDGATDTTTPFIETVDAGDFHAWTPDGSVLMAREASIYAWTPGEDDWTLVADLSEHDIRITRLAVSPDGSQIAMVVEPGDVTL
ncbi:MAG: WD40 repeat domain-containing protein [Gemmatimonadota bacterium]|nr:WD40 repeat domain-containing protein [Gemmatimonadota bacterium]